MKEKKEFNQAECDQRYYASCCADANCEKECDMKCPYKMSKIDISKVDCCDLCFEKYRFTSSKINNPFIRISANHKTIKLCRQHAEELKDELLAVLTEE